MEDLKGAFTKKDYDQLIFKNKNHKLDHIIF